MFPPLILTLSSTTKIQLGRTFYQDPRVGSRQNEVSGYGPCDKGWVGVRLYHLYDDVIMTMFTITNIILVVYETLSSVKRFYPLINL